MWALILVNICFQGEILGPVTLHLFKEINVTAAFSEKNIYLKYHFSAKYMMVFHITVLQTVHLQKKVSLFPNNEFHKIIEQLGLEETLKIM